MRTTALFAALLVSTAANAADLPSPADEYYAAYSIVSVGGEMPIRNVIVKRVGEYFTSYLGYQFDCTTQTLNQTGFYGSVEPVRQELARIKPSHGSYTYMTDRARAKACDVNNSETASKTAHPSTAS